MTIQKPVGAAMCFSGGAENTPEVKVSRFFAPGSLHHQDKNLQITQERNNAGTIVFDTVSLSLETMKAIIAWAEKKED